MLCIRPLPKDFEKWEDEEALRDSRYIFYDYKHGRTWMDGYCTVCHTDVKVRKPHHGSPGKCPHCGKRIVFKAERIATDIRNTADVAYIQKLKDGWVIRYFNVIKDYAAHYGRSYRDPKLYIHEGAREFDTDRIQKVYNWDNFRQTGEYRFCERYCAEHYGGRYILYPRNLRRLFKNESGNRKYFPFASFCKNAKPVNVANLLTEIVRKPQLEFLAKLKLYNIVSDIVNFDYDSTDAAIDLKDKGLFGVLGAVEAVEWVRFHGVLHNGNIQNIFARLSPHKAIRYLDKHGERLIAALHREGFIGTRPCQGLSDGRTTG